MERMATDEDTEYNKDTLERLRVVIKNWQLAGKRVDEVPNLLAAARRLKFTDSALRSVACKELSKATGIAVRDLAIPDLTKAKPAGGDVGPEFDYAKNGEPLSNANNVVKALEWIKLEVYFDEFHVDLFKTDGHAWRDADLSALHIKLQNNIGLKLIPQHIVEQGLMAYGYSRRRDSVRESFEGFKWDGQRRIADLFVRGFGAERTPYVEAVGQNFMRGLAARVLHPGCKADNMPILEGDQGIKKSTGCRALVTDKYFSEIRGSPANKDFQMGFQGHLLCEWSELEALKRGEIETVKGILSCPDDKFRRPYGKRVESNPRRGVFIGTTNADAYLRDDTGNRRFWPIRCGVIDVAWITENREQLFAEAVADVKLLGRDGWWREPPGAVEEQEARFAPDVWEGPVADYLMKAKDTTIHDILEHLGFTSERMGKLQEMRVAGILKRLGWKKQRLHRGGARRVIWTAPGVDISTVTVL